MNGPKTRSLLIKSSEARAKLVRFLLVGGSATLGYILICYCLQALSGWPPFWASLVAYAMMFTFAYIAQRSFTFRSSRHHLISLPLYGALQIACGIFAAIVVEVAVSWGRMPALAASTLAAGSSATVSYLVSSSWIFSDSRRN